MYDDDTRKAYSALMDYIESKYDNIKDNDDFKEKFEELLETDEEFQNMINEFNAKSVYNEDAVNSADDFLALGGKIFPAKEESESVEETTREFDSPKVSRDEVKPSVTKPRVKVPFYKKAINFVNSMPDSIKIVNVASLGVFATLEAFNLIGGGGLAYVGAVIGLPIPIITATAYAIPALYKSYKYGKIGSSIKRLFKGKKEKYEPLPSEEINLVNKENKGTIYFPESNDDKKVSNEEKVEPLPNVSKPEVKSTPVETKVASEPVVEEKTVETFNPKTDTPKFEKTVVKPEVVTPVEPINPTDIYYENNEYDEPIDNVTYDPSDFDFAKQEPLPNIPEVKEEYKPRHMKKNTENYEDGYKEKRIAELESKISEEKENIVTYNQAVKVLNMPSIYSNEDAEKIQTKENGINYWNEKLNQANNNIAKYTEEIMKLKGVKEKKDIYTLLVSRKHQLDGMLASLKADTPENKELRDKINMTRGQIKKYMELSKQVNDKNNPLINEKSREEFAQIERVAYTTTEYVWDELNGNKRTRRGK